MSSFLRALGISAGVVTLVLTYAFLVDSPLRSTAKHPHPIDWDQVDQAYAYCGDGRIMKLQIPQQIFQYGDTEAWVVAWLRNIATDIEHDGWTARWSPGGFGKQDWCVSYAGARAKWMLPARPLMNDEIRKLRNSFTGTTSGTTTITTPPNGSITVLPPAIATPIDK